MRIGRCEDCGASIVWGRTANNKGIPLNPIPVNVVAASRNIDEAPVQFLNAYTIHFDTCSKKPASRRTRG